MEEGRGGMLSNRSGWTEKFDWLIDYLSDSERLEFKEGEITDPPVGDILTIKHTSAFLICEFSAVGDISLSGEVRIVRDDQEVFFGHLNVEFEEISTGICSGLESFESIFRE